MSCLQGNKSGGPKHAGCVQTLISGVKRSLVKRVHREGVTKHGYVLQLQKPSFAVERMDLQDPRVYGGMSKWMFFHPERRIFPMVDSVDEKPRSEGKVLIAPCHKTSEQQLREEVERLRKLTVALEMRVQGKEKVIEEGALSLVKRKELAVKKKTQDKLSDIQKRAAKEGGKGERKSKKAKTDKEESKKNKKGK